jgi:hypothetical protein
VSNSSRQCTAEAQPPLPGWHSLTYAWCHGSKLYTHQSGPCVAGAWSTLPTRQAARSGALSEPVLPCCTCTTSAVTAGVAHHHHHHHNQQQQAGYNPSCLAVSVPLAGTGWQWVLSHLTGCGTCSARQALSHHRLQRPAPSNQTKTQSKGRRRCAAGASRTRRHHSGGHARKRSSSWGRPSKQPTDQHHQHHHCQ